MTKKNRHNLIKEIIQGNEIAGQDILLDMLLNKGFDITQATLSRDIKELKIVKAPSRSGNYTYQLSDSLNQQGNADASIASVAFVEIEFSGQLAVIKTRPGYAMALAGEIDQKAVRTVLGTVAGDDTILLIPRENINRQEVIASLAQFIPNI